MPLALAPVPESPLCLLRPLLKLSLSSRVESKTYVPAPLVLGSPIRSSLCDRLDRKGFMGWVCLSVKPLMQIRNISEPGS
jgi:hypothetical protein